MVEGDQATEEQLLMAVPTDTPGLSIADSLPLIGVSASSTGPVLLDNAEVSNEWLIAGPAPNVMSSGLGGVTGSYETSTLACGLAQASIDFLAAEAAKRPDLTEPMAALRAEHDGLLADLLEVVRGNSSCSKESIRQRANSLVLRSSQAALAAAKGSGYVVGHPAGRWCREAMFFLVWSCPQPVSAANLCELAGITD
jgi:alkylation response protein AidB-like acyl-CoA dehydrogenase